MTTKEKAKELFNRFYTIKPVESIYVGMDRGQAKQSALICIDEILKTYNENDGALVLEWLEVEQEMNKL